MGGYPGELYVTDAGLSVFASDEHLCDVILTHEKLVVTEEEDITPMNKLPVIIIGPGKYKTREGEIVDIQQYKAQDTKSTTSFRCKGYRHTKTPSGRKTQVWEIYHESGAWRAVEPDPRDIVERINEGEDS